MLEIGDISGRRNSEEIESGLFGRTLDFGFCLTDSVG
jgi:hypothetical protein